MNPITVLQQLPDRVIESLLTGLVVAALALAFRSVRQFLLYRRHEFDFSYDPSWTSCEWDIQWEGFRLTIQAVGVHNDYIEQVIIKKQGANPGQTFARLEVSDAFHRVAGWPLYFKLNSITRARPSSGSKSYHLYFVLRRRRW
ncbi:MAG TPA: hypothetical protein VEL79_12560 [Vicinamibacterales bacterium]|nr:hypothetical protein [Vicinamibacterales bacterium]